MRARLRNGAASLLAFRFSASSLLGFLGGVSTGTVEIALWKKVNDPPVRNSQEAFMMEMRAARMVQAAESLLKLVSELKQTAIFSGFASLNDYVEQRIVEFNQQAVKLDCTLSRIAEEAPASVKELESHYYSSLQRTTHPTEF